MHSFTRALVLLHSQANYLPTLQKREVKPSMFGMPTEKAFRSGKWHIAKEEKKDEQEAGLIDRQVTALAFLRDFWENSQKQIDPTQLAELMKDHFGKHPRVQATSTLDQLVVKGLAEKLNTSTSDQSKVSFYLPI